MRALARLRGVGGAECQAVSAFRRKLESPQRAGVAVGSFGHTSQCVTNVWMATNLDLDPALVDEAVAVGGTRTKKEAVTEALREYIARRRQARVATLLYGRLRSKYNYKAQRRRR